jgi:hypothetical protein
MNHNVQRSINTIIIFGRRKNYKTSGTSLLLYLLIKSMIKLRLIIIEEYLCNELYTIFYQTYLSQGFPPSYV